MFLSFRRLSTQGSFSEPRVSQDDRAIKALLKCNATFAEMKPRILAFWLSSQFGKARLSAEVWGMLSLEFVLSLCLPSNK